jgi:group II intron reverse transcriptase/maturase
MSTVEIQIAERARKYPEQALTNLHGFIDEALLHEALAGLNKRGAVGVDGQSWSEYDREREERIPRVLTAFKAGSYRAPNIRRKYIPKAGGKKRPLGLPRVEDKLLQSAVSGVLRPVYEQIFYPCSYGFRPGKSAHQALEVLFRKVSFEGMRYLIDADITNYFGSIDHGQLREFLDLRIKDGVIRRMIDKWLKAGVLEDGQVFYPGEGTPQGGVISPLLANIYLHYVLDEWFTEQIQPRLAGASALIRFADDFLLLFASREDAERVMKVLPKRLGKYALDLHPEKTRLVSLGAGAGKPNTFDFLGFTHYMGKSRKGKRILKRKTSSRKLRASLQRMNEWIRGNRHKPITELIAALNRKLQGHYGYYGITFNQRRISYFHDQTKHLLHKWLNRRGGKPRWSWEEVCELTKTRIPLVKPRIVHSYA